MKVLIIGAGMSGLTLAHQLKQKDIAFEIFERDPDEDARQQGWALSLFGQALSDLETSMPAELGPVDATSHLCPLDLPVQFVFYDVTRPDMRVGVKSDADGKIIRAHRQTLRKWLLQGIDVQFGKRLTSIKEHNDGVTIQFGKRLTSIKEHNDGVTIQFEDGTSASGDFLVGAEGTRSVVRKHILGGKDVMKPLALGSIVGEVALSGEDFKNQLKLAHSGYIVMNSTLGSDDQSAIFCALDRVSDDGKTGYYYYILLWVDRQAPFTSDTNPSWTVQATQQQLAEFAQEKTKAYPNYLRTLVDKVPVEGYKSPGFQLQGVQLESSQIPAGRVIVIGDAAHPMTPFRGEAGVCAFTDAMKLAKTLGTIRDEKAEGQARKVLIEEFRDDMLARGKWAIEISNPVLENYGKYAADYKFGTFGKEAVPIEALVPGSRTEAVASA